MSKFKKDDRVEYCGSDARRHGWQGTVIGMSLCGRFLQVGWDNQKRTSFNPHTASLRLVSRVGSTPPLNTGLTISRQPHGGFLISEEGREQGYSRPILAARTTLAEALTFIAERMG